MNNNITTIEHFEKIIAVLMENGFNKDFYSKAKEPLEAASAYLKTTQTQAALFALLLNNFSEDTTSIQELSKKLKCTNLEMLKYLDDLEILREKKLVWATKSNGRRNFFDEVFRNFPSYSIPLPVIDAVRKGVEYKYKTHNRLKPDEFFEFAAELFEVAEDDEIDFNILINEVNNLFEQNKHISFVKKQEAYGLDDNSALVLLIFICMLLENNEETMCLNRLHRIIGRGAANKIKRSFKSKENDLFEHKLIEFDCKNGMADTEYYHLSKKAIDEFLADVDISTNIKRKGKNIILSESINEKKLYFNKNIEDRIIELTNLLKEENFLNIQKRLGESGMRTGFPCLFSGPPGTGKTETVYQIARKTSRDIVLVDIAESKSAWFGESEKLIKAIFDHYRGLINSDSLAPILLFNEADAILGKRQELPQTQSGPGQTENAIQNIILQEMENLKGILIATTNLTINLDKAFERRFLYKIEFENPDTETKKQLWQSLIPAISSEIAAHLALRYNLTGGQIENISRKCTVNFVLSGTEPTLELLNALCKEEQLNKESSCKIGFTG